MSFFGRKKSCARSGKGKKVVYVTPYRNLALEMLKMYESKGECAAIESEKNAEGKTMFLVYTF